MVAEGHPNRTYHWPVSCPQPHTLLHSAVLLAGHDVTQSHPVPSAQTKEKSEIFLSLLASSGPSVVKRPNQEPTRHMVLGKGEESFKSKKRGRVRLLGEGESQIRLGNGGQRLVETRWPPER